MSDNGNDGKKYELPKGMDEEKILKMASEYVDMTKDLPEATLMVLALFVSVAGKYMMETFALDPHRLRFQRTLTMITGMIRAAYAMGAIKGLPKKEE